MAKITGAASRRRLKDMSAPAPPSAPTYYPPRDEECDESPEYPVSISDTERIAGRAKIYRGRVVEFALTLQVREVGADWVDVMRIDCRHSVVHSHQFFRGGGEERVEMVRIPTGGADEHAWDTVNNEYDRAVDKLNDELDDLVNAWGSR